MYEDIQIPVQGQNVSAQQFGVHVRDSILDLDRRMDVQEVSQQRILGRVSRTTAKTGLTTTPVGVLRIDNIPVLVGYMYRISSGSIAWDADGTLTYPGAIYQSQLHVEFNASPGVPATTSSVPINRTRGYITDPTVGPIVNISDFYVPAADGYISILLSAMRFAGGATPTGMQVYADANNPLTLTVEFSGNDPGTGSGVVL
jgi:hypothetical protein